MKNLIKAITAEQKQHLEDFIKGINKKDVDLNHWQYKDLLPRNKNISDLPIKEQKAYLIKRKEGKIYKSIEKGVNRIRYIMESGEFIGAKISVEWKKSRTWGSNPSGECWAQFKNAQGHNDSIYVKSDSISGCGYDKLSTAVAQCLNQINPLLKLLYAIKDKELGKKVPKSNRDLFGYGSGYGILPSFEGGVGVSCYPKIFEKMGFKFETIANGKTFDVFNITKL